LVQETRAIKFDQSGQISSHQKEAKTKPDSVAAYAHLPALCTGCMLSRALHRLHAFPRLAPLAPFPALGPGCVFLL